MRLVDDDGVVGTQPRIALGLGEQDAVGHELDQAALGHLVVEAHLETHDLAQRRAQLLRHAARHRARGQPTRLGAADHARFAAAGGQAQLRQLGGLARTGLAGDHHHLVFADQLDDVLAARADRQRLVQPDFGLGRGTVAASGRGALDIGGQRPHLLFVGSARQRAPTSQQATEVATAHRIQLPAQGAQAWIGSGIGCGRAVVVHRTAHDSRWHASTR